MAKKAAKKKTAKKTKATAKKAAKKSAKAKKAKKKKAVAAEDSVAVKTKKKTKRKSRAKKDIDIRQRLFWGVFNHAMKPIAKYAFNQKKAAEKRALELSPEGKPPHFVAKVKESIEED